MRFMRLGGSIGGLCSFGVERGGGQYRRSVRLMWLTTGGVIGGGCDELDTGFDGQFTLIETAHD
jgi:hypothetical protein